MANNITKETRKYAVKLVKRYVEDRKVRKDLVKKIKELGFDQPEQKLANLFLDNDLVRINARLFDSSSESIRFLEEWMNADYNVVLEASKTSDGILINLDSNYGCMLDADEKLFESMLNFIKKSQVQLLSQKREHHKKLIEEFMDERENMKKELHEEITKIEKEIEKIKGSK